MMKRILPLLVSTVVSRESSSVNTPAKSQSAQCDSAIPVRKFSVFKPILACNREQKLENFILSPRNLLPQSEQTVWDWMLNTTQDYQLRDFSPENLAIQIGFLRLIGISSISLKEIGRTRGTKECFLLPGISLQSINTPQLTRTTSDVLASILEFNIAFHTKQLVSSSYVDPITHVRSNIIEDCEVVFRIKALDRLYKQVSQLTDPEIDCVVQTFFEASSPSDKAKLIENLKQARLLCAAYVRSKESPEDNFSVVFSRR